MDNLEPNPSSRCTVICRTPGCLNEGEEITFDCSDEVTCGVCNAVITDKREIE